MKALFGRIVVVGALLALGQGLMAQGIVASANGSGHYAVNDTIRTFSFTAVMDDSNITTGQAQLYNRNLNANLHFSINCLSVNNNTATMSGHVVSSATDYWAPGTTIWFKVVDNGEGGQGSPDQITLVQAFVAVDCHTNLASPLTTIQSGNVQVRD